ncbi:17.6 kDa class I heat shock protein 3-like [Dorcoceras hygrometricum]|uniref:17.6 kDa class I heat shock protein 3-like n=1 Tax=Dorcoceras hygrometricum TaxID=472368 RepID=A0A2Z7D6E7_9LAMI|nr:17.6 kDa class I heat shock protein 3-like [Dorcoceras hygrometricum]
MSLIPSIFGNRRSNIFDPFALDIWDPFQGFPFSGAVTSTEGQAQGASSFVAARIDWKETPEAHVFKADIPGLKKEEVKVEVEEGGVLQIRGERNSEKEEKNGKWHHVERSSGKFLRRFRLPRMRSWRKSLRRWKMWDEMEWLALRVGIFLGRILVEDLITAAPALIQSNSLRAARTPNTLRQKIDAQSDLQIQ